MNTATLRRWPTICNQAGFTLIELLLATAGSALVFGVVLSLFVGVSRSMHGIAQQAQANQEANRIISQMVYGVGLAGGLRSAATVTVSGNNQSWQLRYVVPGEHPQTNSFVWSASRNELKFNPGDILLSESIAAAPLPIFDMGMVAVTMRVEKVSGRFTGRSLVGAAVTLRNN